MRLLPGETLKDRIMAWTAICAMSAAGFAALLWVIGLMSVLDGQESNGCAQFFLLTCRWVGRAAAWLRGLA